MNKLGYIPLNTKRVYTMITSKSGCKIYIPVDSDNTELIKMTRDNYQEILNGSKEA